MKLTETHYKLIAKLADGQFYSGQQLADELNVSRTSIWNYLKTLEGTGLSLHAVKGKGTRLAVPIELLEADKINVSLSSRSREVLSQLELLTSTDSTNHYLTQKNAQQRLASGSVCVAENQTAGRGRLGRTWVSPYGQNIYISFLWNFKAGLSGLSGLSLACGVAVCNALKSNGLTEHGLKWPNDILWERKKIGGILVEVQGESQGDSTAVIGIGVNYKMSTEASGDIDQPWVDLNRALNGKVPSRNKVVGDLINEILPVLAVYEDTGLPPYVESWNKYDCHKNKKVNIIKAGKSSEFVAKGISASGELKLLNAQGGIEKIMSGEISLRMDD
ncbi:MAG: bifunctional biotin--[acetyl-CoA-carboxylase] synthetase/biotin operon repressor [Cycloclasticus sp. symbiont of Poecilosclerida sp. M]|nr:MAG: bifunctional biotin--[acetyl-CoA-carboxylase] synthetase/biotin operon repressor [Cycloclasticus sp. symbiont of Poecilosclerida sp. M]